MKTSTILGGTSLVLLILCGVFLWPFPDELQGQAVFVAFLAFVAGGMGHMAAEEKGKEDKAARPE